RIVSGTTATARSPLARLMPVIHRAATWRNAAILFGAVALWALLGGRPTPGDGADLRLSVATTPGTEIYARGDPGFAISPNGRTIVYTAGWGDSTQLHLRDLDRFEPRPLAGTVGGDGAFFSPDGEWIAYFARAQRRLVKISVSGGPPITVAEDLGLRAGHGVWASTDTLYYIEGDWTTVAKVSADGGPVSVVTSRPPPEGWWRMTMSPLPGGRSVLVGVGKGDGLGGKEHIDVMSLETGEHRRLIDGSLVASVAGDDILVFAPIGSQALVAVRFDPRTLKLLGSPYPVLDSAIAVSVGGGTLAFVPVARQEWLLSVGNWWFDQLMLVDREGQPDPRELPQGVGGRFSPDGRYLVYTGPGRKSTEIHRLDLGSGRVTRLTGDEGNAYWPIYTPDGQRVVFNSSRGGRSFVTLDWMPANGGGPVDSLLWGDIHYQPQSWANGGRSLVYTQGPSTNGIDIGILDLATRESRVLIGGPGLETHPTLSPDGKILAWTSDATGRPEVVARRFPDGPIVQVSADGGAEPLWDPGGRMLYFRSASGGQVYAASLEADNPPAFGPPAALFSGKFLGGVQWGRLFDISPDGRWFLFTRARSVHGDASFTSQGSEIRIVPGWVTSVERQLRAAGNESQSRSPSFLPRGADACQPHHVE
ncbi:MAG TPA: hypothetical protein VLL51_08145, partial [Gemmatimonadales bacterium]|nr:hypothetical protein [Gemmatimonadales bacterium]